MITLPKSRQQRRKNFKENEKEETQVENGDKETKELGVIEPEPTVVEEEDDGVSTEVIFSGDMTLKEDEKSC